ncbi:MAG: hypothetical protein JO079_00585 [Frankiaceae bacterium]|nr:hypothetical protein [Frankiaceae bacterium]MBV9369336.1 hypothetical protein [Frankiales bacterium]
MSENPAESPVASSDGDTAKRHGDELAEAVERGAAASDDSDADGEQAGPR